MLGIVQGRLSFSGKKLQCFPKKPLNEFKLASKIGYDFIEFFNERIKNNNNLIWTDDGIKKYIEASKKYNQKIYSFCDNYVINHSLSGKKTLNEIINTIEQLNKLNIKKYILPLYGKSFINKKNKKKISENLSIISKICKKNKIELLIESNMSPKEFFILKKKIKSNNFYFLFDTGNRVLLKKNFLLDICKFKNEIKHVHLKDKNFKDKNVIFGEGEVKFESIFEELKKINYKGSFTIESQRGKNIKNQATKNYIFFKKLINKYLTK
jgi:sugar phosphate isomerase/epimerase